MGTIKQVEYMVSIAKQLGREVATGEDARRIMKIGTWYKGVEETLFNLGLPPNRKDSQPGFVVYETDGRLRGHLGASDSHPIAGCQVVDLPPEKKNTAA